MERADWFVPHNSVPIIGDVPARDPKLGFQEYAEAIARAICDGEPAQFTLAIYGQWGTGKSTLLLEIERRLNQATDVIPVFFDAWRYEETANIVVPLVHHIAGAVRRPRHSKIKAKVGGVLEGILKSLEADFFWGAFRIRGNRAERAPQDGAAFVHATEELDELSRRLIENNARIVLLIDDLDRCRPERVVDVIEAIKVVLNVPGIVSVIAMDYRRLISALAAKYVNTDTNAYSFMEKIVQAEFHLPAFTLDVATYWEDLQLDRVQDPELAAVGGFRALLHGIATDALDSNPRQVKRYLNTFLLNRRVVVPPTPGPARDGASARADVERLAAVIGFQVGYPASFQAWQRKDLTPETEKIIELLGEPDGGSEGRRVADPPRRISAKEYVEKYLKPRLDPADVKAAQILTDRLIKTGTRSPATDLSGRIRIRVGWGVAGPDVDLSALLLTRERRVPDYESFVYYRNRRSFDRAVSHRGDSGPGGTAEEIDVDLDAVDGTIDEIVVALSLYQASGDGPTYGLAALGPITLTVLDGVDDRLLARYPVDAGLTDGHAGATIARLERVGTTGWSFRQTTQAYDTGLAGIGRDYGVELA